MRSEFETRPSRFSTVVFGLLTFLIFGLTGCIAGAIYERNLFGWLYEGEGFNSEEVIGWCGLMSGGVASVIAVWGWRAPRETRFHIAFLAGLVLLVAASFHLHLARLAFQRHEEALGYAQDWAIMELFLHGPGFAGFVATLGMTVIMAALIQDRR